MNEKTLKLELNKVLREIKVHGMDYTFFKRMSDEYGEPIQDKIEVVALKKGLFHISKGFISKKVSDGTSVHGKGQPKLLMSFDDSKEINIDDFFRTSGNIYRVVEKNNIQNYDIVTDLSLELVINGNN